MSNVNFNYDESNDILYISISIPRPSYGDEIEEGIIIRKDFSTDEITGITILDFKKRLESNDKHLDNLPLAINVNSIDFKTILNMN